MPLYCMDEQLDCLSITLHTEQTHTPENDGIGIGFIQLYGADQEVQCGLRILTVLQFSPAEFVGGSAVFRKCLEMAFANLKIELILGSSHGLIVFGVTEVMNDERCLSNRETSFFNPMNDGFMDRPFEPDIRMSPE